MNTLLYRQFALVLVEARRADHQAKAQRRRQRRR
jgi:hypothetical protein